MSRKNEDNTMAIVFFITLLAIVIALLAVYWTFVAIIVIISFFLVGIINIHSKRSKKKLVEKWIDEEFDDSIFIPEEKITIEEIKEECENNNSKIVIELKDFSKRMERLGHKEVDHVNNNQKCMHISKELLRKIKSYFSELQDKLNYSNEIADNYENNESKLLNTFKDLIESSYLYNIEFKKILVEGYRIENPITTQNSDTIDEDEVESRNVVAGALIVNEITKKKKQANNFDEDLVRKGEYNPWNFEEENTEEGDYYDEDDK